MKKLLVGIFVLCFAAVASALTFEGDHYGMYTGSGDRELMHRDDFNFKYASVAIPVIAEPGEKVDVKSIKPTFKPGIGVKSVGAPKIYTDKWMFDTFMTDYLKGNIEYFDSFLYNYEFSYETSKNCYAIDTRIWFDGENFMYISEDRFVTAKPNPNRYWIVVKLNVLSNFGKKNFTAHIDGDSLDITLYSVVENNQLGILPEHFCNRIKFEKLDKEDFGIVFGYNDEFMMELDSDDELILNVPETGLYVEYLDLLGDVCNSRHYDKKGKYSLGEEIAATYTLFFPDSKPTLGIVSALGQEDEDGKMVVWGYGKGGGTFAPGEKAMLSAVYGKDAMFVGWEVLKGADKLPEWLDLTKEKLVIPVAAGMCKDQDFDNLIVVKPIFEPLPLIKVIAAAGGTATGTGQYKLGAKANLKASPMKGNVFTGWYTEEGILITKNTSFAHIVEGDATFEARFVSAAEDMNVTLNIDGSEVTSDWVLSWMELVNADISIESHSNPKLAMKGLPKGMKLVLDKNTEAYQVTGSPTIPGVYKIDATVSNLTNKKGKVYSFKITVPNLEEANSILQDYGVEIPSNNPVKCYLGSSFGDEGSDTEMFIKPEELKVTVKGLPAGLKLGKDGFIRGVPTKVGISTIYVTVNGKTSTFTIDVQPLPSWLVGTFDGYCEGYWDIYKVSLAITSNGKISGKAFDAVDSSILAKTKFELVEVNEDYALVSKKTPWDEVPIVFEISSAQIIEVDDSGYNVEGEWEEAQWKLYKVDPNEAIPAFEIVVDPEEITRKCPNPFGKMVFENYSDKIAFKLSRGNKAMVNWYGKKREVTLVADPEVPGSYICTVIGSFKFNRMNYIAGAVVRIYFEEGKAKEIEVVTSACVDD